MDMVERVARAMDAQAFVAFDKHGRDTQARRRALWQAKRAIEAMREPTEAMVSAAWRAVKNAPADVRMAAELSTQEDAHRMKMRCRWAAMIDAALTND